METRPLIGLLDPTLSTPLLQFLRRPPTPTLRSPSACARNNFSCSGDPLPPPDTGSGSPVWRRRSVQPAPSFLHAQHTQRLSGSSSPRSPGYRVSPPSNARQHDPVPLARSVRLRAAESARPSVRMARRRPICGSLLSAQKNILPAAPQFRFLRPSDKQR